MNFFNFIISNKDSIQIYDDNYLKESECINIYGEDYCGKTSLCFYIIKQNHDKKIAYVCSENIDEIYKNKLHELSNNVYLVHCNKIHELKTILEIMPMDLVIIDSITAMAYIDDNKDIEQLFNLINEKKMNMIIISQSRNYNGKEYFEHHKILNFFSQRIKVEKDKEYLILNQMKKINLNEIWNLKQ
jgi:ABC-type dipeptide/oligopeptide/nickel transport system ATPase subunit